MSFADVALPLALLPASLGAVRLASAASRGGDAVLPFGARVVAGSALLTAVAGWLVLARGYSRGAALGLFGVAALGLLLPREGEDAGSESRPVAGRLRAAHLPWLLGIGGFVVIRSLGALRFPYLNVCDDWPVYFHFPRLILESGGFEEPFSFRRLGVLGAGPFLQGLFWPALGTSANAVADAALGQLAVLGGAGALAGSLAPGQRSSHAALGFAAIALLLSLTLTAMNSSPTLMPYGGALLLLALHVRLARAPAPSAHDALLFGIVAAWLIGLRVSNALFPAALFGLELARGLAARDRARLQCSAVAALATGVALLPWCLDAWRSSGTPLYPLFTGNARSGALAAAPLAESALADFVVGSLKVNRAPVLAVLAGVACVRPEQRGLAAQLAAVAAFVIVATAVAGSAFEGWTMLRYCGPLVVPLLLALGGLVAFAAPRRELGWQRPALAALAAAWLLLPVSTSRESGPTRFSMLELAAFDAESWLLSARDAVAGRLAPEPAPGAGHYARAQARLPADARVVSSAQQPYLWRYDLQTIHSLDCPGQASPPPGMPSFAGAEAMADYFVSLGYTHLAFTPPRQGLCLSSATYWRDKRENGEPIWRRWAPYFLDFMRTQRDLAASREVVFRTPALVVLDLRKRATPAARDASGS